MKFPPVEGFSGFCVGGPYKGEKLVSPIPEWKLARMEPVKVGPHKPDDPVEYKEITQGYYRWVAGIWWWYGWEKPAKGEENAQPILE